LGSPAGESRPKNPKLITLFVADKQGIRLFLERKRWARTLFGRDRNAIG